MLSERHKNIAILSAKNMRKTPLRRTFIRSDRGPIGAEPPAGDSGDMKGNHLNANMRLAGPESRCMLRFVGSPISIWHAETVLEGHIGIILCARCLDRKLQLRENDRGERMVALVQGLASAANPCIREPRSTAILYPADRMVSSSRRGKGAKSPKLSFVKSATPPPTNAPCSSSQGCNPSPPQLASLNSRIESLIIFLSRGAEPRERKPHIGRTFIGFNTPWANGFCPFLHNPRRRPGLFASGAAFPPWSAALAHRRPCAARRKPIDGHAETLPLQPAVPGAFI
jgi:hypothetical protein